LPNQTLDRTAAGHGSFDSHVWPLLSVSLIVRRMSHTRKLLYFPFWLAVLFLLLAYVITFYPGAECGWFLIVTALSVAGLFIPRVAYRVAAALLLILALTSAYSGHRHGVEYRQWLSTHQNQTR
jgi:hypothetical protein